MATIKDRHFGKFTLSVDVISKLDDEGLEALREFLKDFLIFRAEHLFDNDVIVYTAWSEKYFHVIPMNHLAPAYHVEIYKEADEEDPELITYRFEVTERLSTEALGDFS